MDAEAYAALVAAYCQALRAWDSPIVQQGALLLGMSKRTFCHMLIWLRTGGTIYDAHDRAYREAEGLENKGALS